MAKRVMHEWIVNFFNNQKFFATMQSMTIPIRMQIIAGTVTLVCLLLIGGAFFVFGQIGPSPASLLPAGRTLMLVSHLSPDIQKQWQGVLPSLEQAPLKESGTPIAALVKTGTGKTEWIAFDDRGTPQTKTVLLQTGEKTLSSDDAYRQLRGTYTMRSPWLFVRFPNIQLNVNGLAMPQKSASVTIGTGSVKLAWAGNADESFTGPLPAMNTSTVLRVSAGKLGSLIGMAGNLLTPDNRLIAETLLRSWIGKTVGQDISAQYDIMPMLDGAGTLMITDNSGSLRTAMRVLAPNAPQKILTRIEQGALSTGAAASVYQRTFDNKFNFTTVRAGSGAQIVTTSMEGWTLHTVASAHVVSAMRGWEFGLGNDTTLLSALLHTMQSTAVQRTADGVVQTDAVDALLSSSHINLSLPWYLVPGMGKHVFWNMNRIAGGVTVLTMTKN